MKKLNKILSIIVGATCAATISFAGVAADSTQNSNAKLANSTNSNTTTQACFTTSTTAAKQGIVSGAKAGVYTPNFGGCGKYPDPAITTTKKLCFAGFCIKTGN